MSDDNREITFLIENGLPDTESVDLSIIELIYKSFARIPNSGLIEYAQSSADCATGVLKFGIRCFNEFLQANWTGPALPSPIFISEKVQAEQWERMLDVDGEVVYVDCLHKELLVAALECFKVLCSHTDLESAGVWKARAFFVWQRVLSDSNDRGQGNCPTLMQVCLNDYCVALGAFGYLPAELAEETSAHLAKSWPHPSLETLKLPNASGLDVETRAELILEFIVRLAYYGKVSLIPALLSHVSALVGIAIDVTGVEGIKRQYQTVAFAQLAARVKTSALNRDLPAVSAPKALMLTEFDLTTDILEDVKVSDSTENESELTSKLSAIEQCCLIAHGLRYFYSASSRDELSLESVHAIAMRIISTCSDAPPSWIAFSMCLLFRSRSEFFRTNTRGRACFQIDALVDQFKDPAPEAAVRMRHIHCTGYPSTWELQRENGIRMMEVGMVVTAHEMFKKLKMWPLAMDCLAVAGRKQEALDLLDTLEPLTARLLVSKGDMTGNADFYKQAWELSKGKSARAMRSLGRLALGKNELKSAAECFELSLEINPLFDEVWFNLGSIYLKLDAADPDVELKKKAIMAFVRCVNVNPEYVQAWVNLSAVYSNDAFALSNITEAKQAAAEAVRLAPQAWQFWENYTLISARAQDWQSVLRGEQKLTISLARPEHPDINMIRLLVAKVTDKNLRGRVLGFLEDIVLKNKQNLEALKILALMYIEIARFEEAFKTRIVQLREILSLVASVGEVSSRYTAQEIMDEAIDCLGEISALLESPEIQKIPGITTGIALTVRSVPRRIASMNGGQELPQLKALCDKIETIVREWSSIAE